MASASPRTPAALAGVGSAGTRPPPGDGGGRVTDTMFGDAVAVAPVAWSPGSALLVVVAPVAAAASFGAVLVLGRRSRSVDRVR